MFRPVVLDRLVVLALHGDGLQPLDEGQVLLGDLRGVDKVDPDPGHPVHLPPALALGGQEPQTRLPGQQPRHKPGIM